MFKKIAFGKWSFVKTRCNSEADCLTFELGNMSCVKGCLPLGPITTLD